jgi:hypothetical protein
MSVEVTKTCLHCKEVKSLASFYRHNGQSDGRRPECKGCSKKKKQEYVENNPYEDVLNRLTHGIWSRVVTCVDRPKNKIYRDREIKCLLGDSPKEVKQALDKHYSNDIKRLMRKGEKPSVDRIDPYGHYELGNIQIISLTDNLKRIDLSSISRRIKATFPDGKSQEYASILEAAKSIGCKRDTIYAALERPGINRRGIHFEEVS